MVQALYTLYRDVAKDTWAAILRAPAAWVGSILISPILTGVGMLVSPLGIIGGFILGFASAWLYGAYLYLVSESLSRRAPLGWGILRESLGFYLWEVIGVGFVAWITFGLLDLVQAPSMVKMVVGLVAFVLFNPWPEVIHQNRTAGSMDVLTRSFRFMSSNGPEWIIPHLLIVGLGYLVLTTAAGTLLLMFGLGIFVHPLMVFRGALFTQLDSSNRRVRRWKNKF